MSGSTNQTRTGGRVLAALVAVGAMALLTLGPRALVAPARGEFMQLMDAVTAPLLMAVHYGDAERVLNAAMFVPLGATVALLLRLRLWPLAILTGFALSVAVEYAQSSIPGRVPDPDDVLWNTVGAAIGVLAVTAVRVGSALVGRVRRTRLSRRPAP